MPRWEARWGKRRGREGGKEGAEREVTAGGAEGGGCEGRGVRREGGAEEGGCGGRGVRRKGGAEGGGCEGRGVRRNGGAEEGGCGGMGVRRNGGGEEWGGGGMGVWREGGGERGGWGAEGGGERGGWGAEGWGAEGWGAEGWGAEGWGAEGWGAEGWGAEGWGAEGWGAEGWGAEGRGAEGRGAEGRGVGPPRVLFPGGHKGLQEHVVRGNFPPTSSQPLTSHCRSPLPSLQPPRAPLGSSTFSPADPTNAVRCSRPLKARCSPDSPPSLPLRTPLKRSKPPTCYRSSSLCPADPTNGVRCSLPLKAPSLHPPPPTLTAYRSSTFYPHDPSNVTLNPSFNGMLSSNSSINPPFHNWNLVRLIYCDGGGYAGTAGRLEVDSNGTAIYLDGWNITQAVIEDLKSKRGIKSAAQILLSGSSAGGQAVVALCDRIAAAFPWAATKCIADSGFFIDSKDRVGGYTWRNAVKNIVALHKPSWPACQDAVEEVGEGAVHACLAA
ncbi:unnamed protein product [Closterium sp. Naga37s-1]|nr:unnamed protein product [Closterium sp. Naga37s-1]